MTVYQTISETGFVIGRWDPKDEHPQPVDAMCDETFAKSIDVVISKKKNSGGNAGGAPAAAPAAPKSAWDTWNTDFETIGTRRKQAWMAAQQEKLRQDALTAKYRAKAQKKAAKTATHAGAVDRLAGYLPKTEGGRMALAAAVPAAVIAYGNRERIASRAMDTRRNRPASPYYDRGFGKAIEDDIEKALAGRLKNVGTAAKRWYRGTEATPPGVDLNGNPIHYADRKKLKYDPNAQPSPMGGGAPPPPPRTPQEKAQHVKAKTWDSDQGEYLRKNPAAAIGAASMAASLGSAAYHKARQPIVRRAAAKAQAEAEALRERQIKAAVKYGVPAVAVTYAGSRLAAPGDRVNKAFNPFRAVSARRAAARAAQAAPAPAPAVPWKQQTWPQRAETLSTGTKKATQFVDEMTGQLSGISRNIRRSSEDLRSAYKGEYKPKRGIGSSLTGKQKAVIGGGLAAGGGGYYYMNRNRPAGYQQQMG